jgi:hypothetical protein
MAKNKYGSFETEEALKKSVVKGLAEMLEDFQRQGVDFQTAFNMMNRQLGGNFPA